MTTRMNMNDLQLTDALKSFTEDQDKTLTPQATVANFKKRAADLELDILTETRRIDSGRLFFSAFAGIQPKS